jgi:two-component system sensor histidine kinase TctE
MEIARELALHVRRAGEGIGFDLEADAERTLLLDEYDKVYYAVRGAAGSIVAGDPSLRPPQGAESREPGFYDDVLHGDPVRVAVLRTGADAGSGAPPAVIEVAETLGKRRTLAREIFIDGLLPQLLLILIACGMVWVGVARGLSPLQHLQRAVAARSHVDLSPVSAADVPGEVNALVDAINDLMARLDDVLSLQNRFIADAAHQLRTPVAGLKAHVELALRENDPAQTRRALAHLYTSVDNLARLVSQLLSLARNEPSTVRAVPLAAVDLGSLVLEAAKQWVPEAYKRGVDLGFEGAEHAPVNGDAVRLTELVDNLIDNAIRYSRSGGRVTVRVAAQPVPYVSVSDDGPTIPVEERERVFERFHRLLGSLSPGSGLGLAIVREIATLHGATITLDDDADGVGNTFTVSFPEFRPTPPAAA